MFQLFYSSRLKISLQEHKMNNLYIHAVYTRLIAQIFYRYINQILFVLQHWSTHKMCRNQNN